LLLMPRGKRTRALAQPVRQRAKTFLDIACTCIGFALVAWPVTPGCVQMFGDRWLPDTTAAKAISTADVSGRMVTWFNWGEYGIWHFGPKLRVSVDGRRETVYAESVLAEQRMIAEGDPAALERLQ